jgi:Ca2+-transporting ATPase
MTVVAGTFGTTRFVHADAASEKDQTISAWASQVSSAAKKLLIQSIAINSTAFEGQEDGKPIFVGSKTETALLELAKDHLGLVSLSETRDNEQVVHMFPFDSAKKCMGAVVKLQDGNYRLVVKGASEILLSFASTFAHFGTLESEPLSEEHRQVLNAAIDEYANRSLRTIGLVYRDFQQWPPVNAALTEGGSVDFASLLRDLTFFGLVGIQDPVRPGVPEAVRKAQKAGVTVRMVTGDNMQTARAIATECLIYTEGGLVMEGPDFRRLSEEQLDEVLPRLQVLARSSPEDKRILVQRLKTLGEIVAVTGDGTNDAPALKAANVGFSMVSGTEVAKEASSIILMDDNFASIITALMWGRAVNDAVQKFLQVSHTRSHHSFSTADVRSSKSLSTSLLLSSRSSQRSTMIRWSLLSELYSFCGSTSSWTPSQHSHLLPTHRPRRSLIVPHKAKVLLSRRLCGSRLWVRTSTRSRSSSCYTSPVATS